MRPEVFGLASDTRTAQLAKGPQTFTYDDDGNLLSDGIWDYTWDAENRLAAMETVSAAIGAIPAADARWIEFKYDYLGRRVEKIVHDGWNGSTYATVASHDRYIYDGWNLIAEYAVTLGPLSLSLTRSYTWGLDIVRSLTSAGGVGALLQITDHASGKSYLPAFDANGNVTALINGAASGSGSGDLAAAYEYGPYGEVIRMEAPDAMIADQPFRFSTKFTDHETGLLYYGYRYYDPSNGRFLGRDPIEESGGLNLYGFVGNNPINSWDYLGMTPTNIQWTNSTYTPFQPTTLTGSVPVAVRPSDQLAGYGGGFANGFADGTTTSEEYSIDSHGNLLLTVYENSDYGQSILSVETVALGSREVQHEPQGAMSAIGGGLIGAGGATEYSLLNYSITDSDGQAIFLKRTGSLTGRTLHFDYPHGSLGAHINADIGPFSRFGTPPGHIEIPDRLLFLGNANFVRYGGRILGGAGLIVDAYTIAAAPDGEEGAAIGGAIGGALGATGGALAGSVLPGPGTIVGGILGGLFGGFGGSEIGDEIQDGGLAEPPDNPFKPNW